MKVQHTYSIDAHQLNWCLEFYTKFMGLHFFILGELNLTIIQLK